MEVQLEEELVGVEVEVEEEEEEVVFLTENWFVHIPFVLQIQWNDPHMNRLSSIAKTGQSQIKNRNNLLQFFFSDSKQLIPFRANIKF